MNEKYFCSKALEQENYNNITSNKVKSDTRNSSLFVRLSSMNEMYSTIFNMSRF